MTHATRVVMAKKKAEKEFKPGDKVIWVRPSGFDPREPVIAWVVSEKIHPSLVEDKVRVTRHEKDVETGRGQLDKVDYVHSFSTKFWEYCMAWMDRKAELGADLKKLQKGKY